jgi:hypothetical protein
MPNEHETPAVAGPLATADDTTPRGSVTALAFELRQAGAAEQGLGFALRTLGSDRVIEELRTPARFGARCGRRARLAPDRDERAAWTILAASGPRAIERRLERDGLIRRRRVARAGRTGRQDGAPVTDRNVTLLRGRAEFGEHARRSPFQEQLAEVALALAESA